MQQEADILILGGTILTQDDGRRRFENGGLVVQAGALLEVGTAADISARWTGGKVIRADGKFIFPGLINTHTHLFQTFMKGLGEGLPLYRWLNAVTAPSTVAMTHRDAYLAAVLGLMESLHSGATTVLDYMYALPCSELYHEVARAYQDVQVRGILGWGLLETGSQHGLAPALFRPVEASLAEVEDFTRSLPGSQLTVALAPGIIFGITRRGFDLIRDFAQVHSMLITLHVNETADDNLATLEDCGQSTLQYLDEAGILAANLLAVHCVQMTEAEIGLLREHEVKVSHNPVSNMYLGAGAAPILKMRQAGITVSLATDGAASNNSQDMLEVLKCTGLMHKMEHKDPSAINAQAVLDMATRDAASALNMAGQIGSLEAGKKADLFIFNPACAKAVPTLDPVATLVFSASQACIETVLVGGRVVLDGYRPVMVDEQALLEECQAAAGQLAERAGTKRLITF